MKLLRKANRAAVGALLLVLMLAVASFVSFASRAHATPEHVQSKYGSIGTGTRAHIDLVNPTTAGNLVVVYAVWSNTSEVSLTDDQGNEYQKVSPNNMTWANPNNYSSQVFYAKNVKGGATILYGTFASQVDFGVLYFHEYSGMDTSDPVDATNVAFGRGVTLDSGNITTTRPDDLIFGAGASEGYMEAGDEDFTVRLTDEGNVTQEKLASTIGTYNSTATHGGGKWVMHVVAFKAADVSAPTVPANVSATANSPSVVDLDWTASTDNVGVTGYEVYRDGNKIATPTQTTYQDTGLSPNTNYTYMIKALDAAGNVSAESASSSVTTLSDTCPLPDYPNANCTGVPAGTQLTDFVTSTCTPGPLHGETCDITAVDNTTVCTRYREAENGPISDPICAFTTANHVVEDMNINACAEIQAPGVVIRNSKLSCGGSWVVMSGFGYSGTPVLLEDVEISCLPEGATDAVGKTGVTYNNYTLRRANIHSCENATAALENVTIEDSYLHDLFVVVGVSDADGVQIFQNSNNITIKHNTIDGGNGNSAITSPRAADGMASNVLIQDNMLSGGSYTLYCQQDAPGINYRVIDNYFGNSAFGPWLGCEDETQVTGNRGNGIDGGSEGGGEEEEGNGSTRLEDLERVAWEGGPSYYGNFPLATAWNDPNFFPIGVWFEQVDDQAQIDLDKSVGINTYFELGGSSDLALVRNNDMYAVQKLATTNKGSETVGDLLTDEADMTYGAGSDSWSGLEGWNTCTPIQDQGGQCGYTVMQHFLNQSGPGNGRFKYANYGKGVLMWQTAQQAAAFVNGYTSTTSADMYFYTDPFPCSPDHAAPFNTIAPADCRKAANYGLVIDKMRQLDALDGQRQPIYAFVEDGHPFSEASAPTITGDQLAGAVFSSLIHEARGIIYFNHSFGGDCLSHHVLREACGDAIRPKVTETNARIKDLAPVLNTQSYKYSFNNQLETMMKGYDGSYYIFAMQKRTHDTGTYEFTLPEGMEGSTVQVLYENRTLPIVNGTFTDGFAAEYSYHIYKITP